MALLRPNTKIQHRWHGALEASLAQAPLETFLRSNGLPVKRAAYSENIARAVVYLVGKGMELHFIETQLGLGNAQHTVVARNVCVITQWLATSIAQPACWRVAALVGTAELLRPWIGLQGAAISSASLVNRFLEGQSPSAVGGEGVSHLLQCALQPGQSKALVTLAAHLAAQLSNTAQEHTPSALARA